MKTVASLLSIFFIAVFSTFGARVPLRSVEDLSAEYADFLTNVTFQLRHTDVIEDSLNSFRKAEDYNPDAMLEALVSIVERRYATTNDIERRMARAAINAMGYLQLTNALPILNKWTLGGGDMALSSFSAYGEITNYDERYLDLGLDGVKVGALNINYLAGEICSTLSADKKDRLSKPLDEKTRSRMQRMLLNYTTQVLPYGAGRDTDLCKLIPGYSNSVERVAYLQKIHDGIDRVPRPCEGIRQLYFYDNKAYEYDDWTNRIRTRCKEELARIQKLPEANSVSVAEIIRTKSFPEGERLNMTTILDAEIVAIEAVEAYAARHAAWERRLRVGALFLPIPVIAFVILFVLKKKKIGDKARRCRTVEMFVIAMAIIAEVGVVCLFKHRHEVRHVIVKTDPPVLVRTEPEDWKWLAARLEEYRREKERADAAVLNYRVTNQLDSIIGQNESLKLAHNQLLLDLAQAESRMSNETVAAEMDLLRKQMAAIREKVVENVRVRAELQDRISKEEDKLIQLEHDREFANYNFLNFFYHKNWFLSDEDGTAAQRTTASPK